MRLEYVSIALGIAAVILGFVPLVPLQVVGVALGIAGIVCSRRAVKRDYRRDMPATVGLVSSITGTVVSALTPVIALVATIVGLFV